MRFGLGAAAFADSADVSSENVCLAFCPAREVRTLAGQPNTRPLVRVDLNQMNC